MSRTDGKSVVTHPLSKCKTAIAAVEVYLLLHMRSLMMLKDWIAENHQQLRQHNTDLLAEWESRKESLAGELRELQDLLGEALQHTSGIDTYISAKDGYEGRILDALAQLKRFLSDGIYDKYTWNRFNRDAQRIKQLVQTHWKQMHDLHEGIKAVGAASSRKPIPTQPLTDSQQAVFNLLWELEPGQGLSGDEIVRELNNRHVWISSTSSLTTHIIPALRKAGIHVENVRTVGYFIRRT